MNPATVLAVYTNYPEPPFDANRGLIPLEDMVINMIIPRYSARDIEEMRNYISNNAYNVVHLSYEDAKTMTNYIWFKTHFDDSFDTLGREQIPINQEHYKATRHTTAYPAVTSELSRLRTAAENVRRKFIGKVLVYTPLMAH